MRVCGYWAKASRPADLTWIMPRDSWLLNRANTQPGPQFASAVMAGVVAQNQAIAQATSIGDLFDRLVGCQQLLRLNDQVRPRMYRCAIVSPAELQQLRRIEDVVRLGHVRRVEECEIVLDGGTIPTSAETLHIDCSADGLEQRPAIPVFGDSRITLQPVRRCQQVFSAAFVAHVEAAYSDELGKERPVCSHSPSRLRSRLAAHDAGHQSESPQVGRGCGVAGVAR